MQFKLSPRVASTAVAAPWLAFAAPDCGIAPQHAPIVVTVAATKSGAPCTVLLRLRHCSSVPQGQLQLHPRLLKTLGSGNVATVSFRAVETRSKPAETDATAAEAPSEATPTAAASQEEAAATHTTAPPQLVVALTVLHNDAISSMWTVDRLQPYLKRQAAGMVATEGDCIVACVMGEVALCEVAPGTQMQQLSRYTIYAAAAASSAVHASTGSSSSSSSRKGKTVPLQRCVVQQAATTAAGFPTAVHDMLELLDCAWPSAAATQDMQALVASVVPRAWFITGLPGSGKTAVAHAAAAAAADKGLDTAWLDCRAVLLAADGLPAGLLGSRLTQEMRSPACSKCALLVLEHVDELGTGADDDGRMRSAAAASASAVAALVAVVEAFKAQTKGRGCILSTASVAGNVSPKLAAAGVASRTIMLPRPDEAQRHAVLTALLGSCAPEPAAENAATGGAGLGAGAGSSADKAPTTADVIASVAAFSAGFTPRELHLLCNRARRAACRRGCPAGTAPSLADFAVAAAIAPPVSGRSYSAVKLIPRALAKTGSPWASVGGYSKVKDLLMRLVQWPTHHPDRLARLGVDVAKGILLHGPSGCGKTLIANAVAAAADIKVIQVKAPELMSKYFGDSEQAVRRVFAQARSASPCILFFDELDAIAAKRSLVSADAATNSVQERVLSTLLNELDGVDTSPGVIVLAATSMKDALDDALVRSGRMDAHVHIGMPDADDRLAIMAVHTARMPLAADVNLAALVPATAGWTCAEVAVGCRAAGMNAMRRESEVVASADFLQAFNNA